VAHSGPCLLLRDNSSFLNLHNGSSGLLLHGGLTDSVTVGSSISGGTFSRGRWRKIVEEEEYARQAVIDKRERERKSKVEAKRKARIEAEAVRKAKTKADHAALARQVQALIGGSRAEAAQAARAMTSTLDKLRLDALAANSARQRALNEPKPPPPKPDSMALIKDIMKRIQLDGADNPDIIRDIMKHDLVSDIMKHDLVSDVMKRNKDKYGLK
jgi:hypothetical protein